MATKRATTSKAKASGFSAQIRQLETCRTQDQAKLEKIYPKVLADIDKAIKNAVQELKKTQGKSKTTKATKSTARATKIKLADLAALKKKLDSLKAEKSLITSSHKKLLAQKKVLQQFEKEWAKKSRVTKKPRKLSKSVPKAKIAESSFIQNLVEAE